MFAMLCPPNGYCIGRIARRVSEMQVWRVPWAEKKEDSQLFLVLIH